MRINLKFRGEDEVKDFEVFDHPTQETGSILGIGFALSNLPHFNNTFLIVGVSFFTMPVSLV